MNQIGSNLKKAIMREHAPLTVEERARQSFKTSKEDSNRKRLEGEDEMI